jgi:hypothetical protein
VAELTLAASGVRALLALAVAHGANRRALIERSRIDPKELEDRDNRIPFSKYVALMKAGQELCNDPALALHFGETVDPKEISFTHDIGAYAFNAITTRRTSKWWARDALVKEKQGTYDTWTLSLQRPE